jgi:diacylglycerol kinase family enzyme
VIPVTPLIASVRSLPHLYDGSLRSVKNVSTAQVHRMWVEEAIDGEVLLDLDGEQSGSLPLSVEVLPKALFVL